MVQSVILYAEHYMWRYYRYVAKQLVNIVRTFLHFAALVRERQQHVCYLEKNTYKAV